MNTGRIRISQMALDAINVEIATLFLPPVVDAAPLRRALAEFYRVDEECVVVGSGSTEVINALMFGLACRRGDVLTSWPAFSLYSILARFHGFGFKAVALKDYAHDIKSLARMADSSTRVIFLDSPHYITGKTVPTSAVVRLANDLPEIIIVVDNVYGEFQASEISSFVRKMVQSNPNILVCRSFSKAHALLGLRIGYGIGHPALIEGIINKIVPYSVNSIAQAAATASLRDTENRDRNVGLNEVAKRMACELLHRLGIPYVPTESSALLINFGDYAERIATLCEENGIKCRDEGKCGIQGHIQVHLIDPDTVTPFLAMVHETFGKRDGL